MTRVLIADPQLGFGHRLRQMLKCRRDMQVVGVASDAQSASEAILQLRPDVLLIDLALCQQSAPQDPDVTGSSPQRTIVMLPGIDNSAIIDAFRLGAQGILLKTADPAVWGKTIRRVVDGQYCFDNGSLTVLLQAFRASIPPRGSFAQKEYGLTTRELDILAEVAAGHSNREVGHRFSICERTVKHHLTSIFDKVGVSSRLELALFAVKHRLVAAESVIAHPPEKKGAPSGGGRPAVVAAAIS